MTHREEARRKPQVFLRSTTIALVVLVTISHPQGARKSQAASQKVQSTKAQEILDRWKKRKSLKGLKIGVAMQGVNGRQQAQTDADRLYNPASGTKLLTTAAAMLTWPLDKQFPTKVYGLVNDGQTDSNGLWVVGGGAPKLLFTDLEAIVEKLKDKGLKQLAGPLHIDTSIFDGENLPPAYEQKSTTSAYRASIGAFGVDYGAITLSIKPKGTAKRPDIQLTSAEGYAVINNEARLVAGKKNNLNYRLIPLADGRMKVTIRGKVGRKHPRFNHRLRMLNPNLGSAHILRSLLTRRGITGDKEIVDKGKVPSALPLLIEHKGKSLRELLTNVNVYSNNFMAESLFKHLGKNWLRSQTVVAQALESLGLKRETFNIVNGSGLYRATTITPASMLKLLIRMANHPKLGSAFRKTLAVSGQPGTLHKRLKGPLRGAVRGKTGTLNEVVSLSGYITSQKSGILAFAIFINESSENRITKVRQEIDRLIRQWSRL